MAGKDRVLGEQGDIFPQFRTAFQAANEEEAAYSLITKGLRNPSVTVEDYSTFLPIKSDIPDDNAKVRYLVMIPKPLDKLTVTMETYYYQKSVQAGGPARLTIRKDIGGLGGIGAIWAKRRYASILV